MQCAFGLCKDKGCMCMWGEVGGEWFTKEICCISAQVMGTSNCHSQRLTDVSSTVLVRVSKHMHVLRGNARRVQGTYRGCSRWGPMCGILADCCLCRLQREVVVGDGGDMSGSNKVLIIEAGVMTAVGDDSTATVRLSVHAMIFRGCLAAHPSYHGLHRSLLI